jgi:hypothetical protein
LSITALEESPDGPVAEGGAPAVVALVDAASRRARAEIFADSSAEIARRNGGDEVAGEDDAGGEEAGAADTDGRAAPAEEGGDLGEACGAKIGGSGSAGSPAFAFGSGWAATSDAPHEAKQETRNRGRMDGAGREGRTPGHPAGSVNFRAGLAEREGGARYP